MGTSSGSGAQSRPALGLLALALVPLVGLGDYLTGADVAFTLLYLGPIALATWYAGRRAGVAVVTCCAATWLGAELLARRAGLDPVILVWNLGVELAVFLLFALLVASLHRRLAAEAALARTDALTGLPNRRAFVEAVAIETERAQRYQQAITLALIDLDGFKAVNDRLGHDEGDVLLRSAAEALRRSLRAFDVPCRLGGDEFAVLLPSVDAVAALPLLARLKFEVLAAIGGRWPVTLSCGAATFVSEFPPLDGMLAEADALLYEVKRSGKNSVRVVSSIRRTDGG